MSAFWVFIIICVICGTISNVAASKVKKGDADYAAEDTQMMQEIYRGLQRMEERIEALETLIMDRAHERSVHSDFE